MRKALTMIVVFSLFVSSANAFRQGQGEKKEEKKKGGLGSLIKITKPDDAQKGKSGEQQKKGPFSDQVKQQEQDAAPLVAGSNLEPDIDPALANAVRNRQLEEQREYETLYSRAEVDQYKQKLQPTASELDALRQQHEALLKQLGLPELSLEEKANIENKERVWRSADARMNEVYNDSIFLSKLASRPPDSPFRQVAQMIAGAHQDQRITWMQGGAAFIFNTQREDRTSYLNLAALPVMNTLPDQLKLRPLPDLPAIEPLARARQPVRPANEPKPAAADAPELSKKRKTQTANAGSTGKKSPAPKKGQAAAQPKPKADPKMADNGKPAEIAGKGQSAQASGSSRGVGVAAKKDGADATEPPSSTTTATPAPIPAAPIAENAAPVKSPQVQIREDPSAKASAAPGNQSASAAGNATATAKKPSAKPEDNNAQQGKGSKIGGFMKDLGKATGKVAYQTIDPAGAEQKELKTAYKRTFSRIDAEDQFFFANRMRYNQLYEQFNKTPTRSEKERIRAEMAGLRDKERDLESLYQKIKLKHDQLNLQQNAINIAEDSAHYTAGKYASGIKNILITRASYVEVKKYHIPKAQWPELYYNRFVCPAGEDCKATYEKLAKENFAAVEKAAQAKDPNAKLDGQAQDPNAKPADQAKDPNAKPADQAKDPNAKPADQAKAPSAKPEDEAGIVVLPRATETLRKPNKCEQKPFAFEKSDGNCWVMQEVDGVRIFRSRFPFWEAHRSLETLQEGIATFIVYSAFESLLNGKPTVSAQGFLALTGSVLETAFLPRQLTEVSDVYYKVVIDRSYSQRHLGFITDEISKSLPNVKPYFAPSLEEYAKADKPWFTPNGPSKELKEFVNRAEQANNGVKFDAILEWDNIPNTEATRLRVYSLAAAEQIKGKTPVAFEFLYPGVSGEKKPKDGKQPPDLTHLRWFGQEPVPDYKPEGYFKPMDKRKVGEMVFDRKEVFHYALNYFIKDMRELQQ
jgi:hypothetical protein